MKTKDSKAQAVLLANLQDAVEMEAHLQLIYHCDHRLLKFMKYSDHKKLAAYGEDLEDFMEQFMRLVFMYDGTVQYEAGTITSQDPTKSPSDTLVAVFTEELAREEEIKDKFEDYCLQAWEAKQDEPRNVWEHAIKLHNEHINWLKSQVRWSQDLGPKDFAASGGRIG